MGILLIEDGNAPDRYRIGKAFARIVLSFHAMRTHWGGYEFRYLAEMHFQIDLECRLEGH
jgi:hypothetical protein